MFRELKRIWNEQAFTKKIVSEFSTMLDYSEEMLKYALKVIINKGKGKKSDRKIYFKDQKINITEQEIRKRILVHLSTNPGGNLPACLMLIGLAKDAERLGDYVKNIFELNEIVREYGEDDKLFRELFEDIGDSVLELYSSVNRAFKESNPDLAMESATKARVISKKCENIISELLEKDYPTQMAVTLALGARYFKRVALHLSNIASSIFLPLPEMDYINGKIDEE